MTKHDKNKTGDAHHNAKITERGIENMRKLYARGWKQADIGREYGLHRDTVNRLLRGRGRVGQTPAPPRPGRAV